MMAALTTTRVEMRCLKVSILKRGRLQEEQ